MGVSKKATGKTRLIFRCVVFFVAFAIFACISTFAWFKLHPISFRQFAFEPVRDSLYFHRELQPFKGWNLLQKQPEFRSQRIEIPSGNSEDLLLIADLWEPDTFHLSSPALIILHGSTPRGRHHGLVRMLAHRFQKDGWIVLTPDARGFGESEDPHAIQNPVSWRNADDVKRYVDFLHQMPAVDKNRIFVFGHSMGGAMALEGALDDPRVAALILVGPPRYISDDGADFWNRVRFSAVRKLPEVVSQQVILDNLDAGDITWYARHGLFQKFPKPILLLDGEFEKEAEHRFLENVSKYFSPLSEYQTVPGAGHYCGVYHFPGTQYNLWRQDLFESCVSMVQEFIERIFQ